VVQLQGEGIPEHDSIPLSTYLSRPYAQNRRILRTQLPKILPTRCAELHLLASGMGYADQDFEKAESSDVRSDALCFLAHDATDYLPVLTNWMQSPWFLKLWGKLNLCHPPFLH
jgi:hypothetical protein